ncbi:MAG TPA: VOC family protein [Ktedonobacterales bacterium]|nr:VOC family protein [Ktedonobacterales bacterium]
MALNIATPQRSGVLPADTTLGPAHLQVADLDRSVAFYTETLGFRLLERVGDTATLGAGDTPWLLLTQPEGAQPRPPRTTGLYHVAILTPSRAALARSLRRLVEQRYPLSGASDHLVSEALYLDDPDGNGLEIYRDRPRAEWYDAEGNFQMGTLPLDVQALLAEGLADERPWDGLEPATRVGHMHVQVADLGAAVDFYAGVLGFDVMLASERMGAAFVSAGGYHHHLGINTWGTRGAPAAAQSAVGLRRFDVVLPDAAALAAVTERLRAAGVAFETDGGAVIARDPSGNAVRLRQ